VAVGEGSFRQGPSLSLFDMLVVTRTDWVRELDVPLVVCPLRWFFCLLGPYGSFHFVPSILPLGGGGVFLFFFVWPGVFKNSFF